MQAINQRAWKARLAPLLILGVAAAATSVVMLMCKAPAASAVTGETKTTDVNFVVRCGFSHAAQVDPIVSPGMTMADHMHLFFGNTTTDKNSTYTSLRAGGTTCERTADKAAYWIPKVFWRTSTGKTTALKPSQGLFYYALGGKSPRVRVKPQPKRLQVVTKQGSHVNWRCVGGTWSHSPPSRCSNGMLVVQVNFPDCSDGTPNSSDHMSQMAFAKRRANGRPQTCPSSHPIPVPQLSTNILFNYNGSLTSRGTVTLSSGRASTMHADFFNAWDQQALKNLVDRCINAGPFTTSNPKPSVCVHVMGT
jgi:hypothetical protein